MVAEDDDEIYNLLTMEVMTEKVSRHPEMRRYWATHVSGIHLRDDFVCGT